MRRIAFSIVSIAAALALAGRAGAETFRVGTTQPNRSVRELVDRLKPGDVVEIDPGVYRENMKIKVSGTKDAPIVIRGAAGKDRPIFDATGLDCSGKGSASRAIFQIEGGYLVLEHLEITGSREPEGHADGIRMNRSPYALIRDCKIHHNDHGVFSADSGTTIVELCEVFANGSDKFAGYSHNFYVASEHMIVRGCYIHDSHTGQNFKSRSHFTELWYNWIADSDDGEVSFVDDKKLTTRPDSNALMVGNVIISKAARGEDNNPTRVIEFAQELKNSHNGTLFMFHNTVVSGNPKNALIRLRDKDARLVCSNNILFGSDIVLRQQIPARSVTGRRNWVQSSASAPDGFVELTRSAAPGFMDLAKRDFRLRADSACVRRGSADLEYVDGDGVVHKVVADYSYFPHLKLMVRKPRTAADLGAYQSDVPFSGKE